MKKPLHCGQPAKPYVKQFFRDDKRPYAMMTGFRCRVCGALLLPEENVRAIEEHWRRTEPDREKLRLEGIEFDNGFAPIEYPFV